MLRKQGMLFPLSENPFHIASRRIPGSFLTGFEHRRCSDLSCDACRYCADVAAECVTIDPDWRREQIDRLKQARESLADGRLWRV
jgi:hypothetical protein